MSLRIRVAILSTVMLAFFIAGCGDQGAPLGDASQSIAAKAAAAPPEAAVSADSGATDSAAPKDTVSDPMPRKIIYTATLEMNAVHFQDAVDRLIRAVKANNGYVAETNVTGTGDQPKTGTWKVRIPAAQYDGFLTAVGGIGEVTSSSSTSEDVSEEFYDVQARLKNKRVEEARLLQHLQSSTGNLSDILLVEKEVSRVREEIERMEGRVRYLAHQSDFTTITVNIHELQSLHVNDATPSFGTQIVRAFIASLTGLKTFTESAVLVVAYMLPWLAICTGIGLPISVIVRKRSVRKLVSRQNQNSRGE